VALALATERTSYRQCQRGALVTALGIINLRQPSGVGEFRYGRLELFHIAGQVIGRDLPAGLALEPTRRSDGGH
jgi:hypothetical protein